MAGKFFSKILDYISFDDPELEEQEMDMIDEQDDEILAAEPTRRRSRRERDRDREQPEMDYEEPASETAQERERPVVRKSKIVNMPSAHVLQMVVNQPRSYDDAQDIIDNLKADRPVVVNLEVLDLEIAQRVLDFISGSVYALNGSIQKVSRCIFVLAPANVDVSGNIGGEINMSSFIDLGGRYEY